MTLKVILRSLSSTAEIVSSCCFFFTYYFNVAIICLSIQAVLNLNILTCIVNQNMVYIFGMALQVISRPFKFEFLKLCHFIAFFLSLLDYCTEKVPAIESK